MKRGAPSGLLTRTLAVVLAVGLLAGLAGFGLAARIAGQWEARHQRETLAAMLDMAQPAASAACYVRDQALAAQVVQELLASANVRGAILRAGPEILAQASRPGGPGPADRSGALSRPIPSPFSATTPIGELILVPDPLVARSQGARTAGLIRAALFGLTLVGCLALALALHGFIIRPITAFSDQLHRLEAAGGGLLEIPKGHDGDEIGRLVRDTNHLIERLVQKDWLEQGRGGPAGTAPQQGVGVFALRGDGALEAWTPACLAVLGLGAEPLPGMHFPALCGAGAALVADCLGRCPGQGDRVATTFRVWDPESPATRWVHLALERIGPDWLQGRLDEVAPQGEALSWDGVERRRAAGS
jgi:hypothetical protein